VMAGHMGELLMENATLYSSGEMLFQLIQAKVYM